MKRQFSLLMALSLGVGATVFACGDDETETTPTGTATVTGTGAGTTPTGTGTGTATGAGTTTGTGTATGGGTATGTGSTCQDNDNAAWQGGGPGCYSDGGGGVQLPGPTSGDAPDDSADARYLGEIEDDDDCGAILQGVLNGSSDVDWYYYHGDEHVFALVSPYRDRGTDQDIVMCAYLECDNGDTADITCPTANSTEDTLEAGGGAIPGCCTDGQATDFELNMTTVEACSIGGLGDDSANIYIKISGELLSATDCVDYDVAFNF